MIRLLYRGAPTFLVTEPPDWSGSFQGKFSVLTHTEKSLTARESRRAYSAALRCRLRYTSLLTGANARALTGALRQWTVEPVILPFWPGVAKWATRTSSPIQGGLQVVWRADGSQWTVFESGSEPSWPAASDLWAPALWGDLEADHALERWNDDLLRWTVEFTESGPPGYALVPPSAIFPTGPLPPGHSVAPTLFPFPPQWDRRTDHLSLHIIRESLGFRRQRPATFHPQAVAFASTTGFLLTDPTQIGEFLRFVMDHAGRASFWMPAGSSILRLQRDLVASESLLPVTDSAGVSPGDYVVLVSGAARVGRQIVSVDSPTQVTLDAAVGQPWTAALTTVSKLPLVCLDPAEVNVEWTHASLAIGRLPVRELPPEYSPPSDESPGVTLGDLPARAVLFTFTQWIGDSSFPTWWTNYESDLVWAGQRYVSADFAHGDHTDSLDLERTGLDLMAQLFPGNPLIPLVTQSDEGPLTVAIQWADLAAGTVTGVTPVFTGEATRASIRGSRITVHCTPGGARFDALLPRLLRGPGCNATLFHDGCHLNPADWRWTARVASPVVSAWPYVLTLAGLTYPGTVAPSGTDWFAGGWVEWGSGSSLERRPMVGSSPPVSNVLTVTLSRWFSASPAIGDPVVLFPGCDQQASTCRNKFANYLNFRGHPFTPAGNPTLVKRSSVGSGGKK